MSEPAICYTYPQPLTQKSAASPGSNFNQQGGSIFNQRRHLPDDAKYNIVGMRQKLNLLSERLLVAWAGNAYQARQVFRAMLELDQAGRLSIDSLQRLIDDAPEEDVSEVAFIGVVITPDTDCAHLEQFDFHAGMFTQELEASVYEITVAGTGTQSFIEALPALLAGISTSDKFLQADQLAAALLGAFFPNEILTGSNLLEWWGGAFEIATFQNNTMGKHSDFLFTFWRVLPGAEGEVEIALIPRFIKQNYYEDVLIIQDMHAKLVGGRLQQPTLRAHFVLPLMKVPSEYDFSKATIGDFSHTTLCAFILPADELSTDIVGLRIYSDPSGGGLIDLHSAKDHLVISLRNSFVTDIEKDVTAAIGRVARLRRIGN